ncbi:hypothetical protein [Thalassococcus lentus]|uniref:LPXTG cell wall anchor domain-containing protein n=1 Tax=Thalassococcus lentus TaxID=1210524 RepID=A0ABT4XUW5_9RHOB|nr:hypothetical protein [Thalassococcus lentus]MDA7425716.1 hypothetical protein [Thalassococcus lentus]
MKRLMILASLSPTAVFAQFTVPEVHYDPPPTQTEIYFSNPDNWVQLGILAALVGIGVLLLVRWKGSSKD